MKKATSGAGGREPYRGFGVAEKTWGVPAMPSAAYFRRQADICLRLSLIASDEEVSNRLIIMAREYVAKADAQTAAERTALPDLERNQAAVRLALTAATRVAGPAVAPADVTSARRRGRKAGLAAALD